MSKLINLRVQHIITEKYGYAVGEHEANGGTTKTKCYYIRWDDGHEDWYAATTVRVVGEEE